MDNKLDSNDNIKFLVKNLSKGKREESINSISSMIPIFRNKEQKKNYLDLFDKYFIVKQKFNDGKITKDEFKKIKEDFENSFTKDKAYKWYASDGNYEAQIYMVDGKWQMEIINRFRVFEHLEAKDGYALWHKIYPNAKKIMTLRANDVVKANIKRDDDCKSFGKLKKFISDRFSYYPDINNLNFYFRVKEMTDGKITLLPIHIAEVDKYTKVWSGSITALQKYNIQKVYLNALGKEINKN